MAPSVPVAEKTEGRDNDVAAFQQQTMGLLDIIVSPDETLRHTSLSQCCKDASTEWLLRQCEILDAFSRTCTNLYEKVRALFFLYAVHRFHLRTSRDGLPDTGSPIPYQGYKHLLDREFTQAIDIFLQIHRTQPSKAISSALAKAYYHLGFQTLADQVRVSVRNHPGNSWMFHLDAATDQPLRIRPTLLKSSAVLVESTPVRMDLSHCGWSDIFFLGMDFPQGARVLNVSVDLAVRGSPVVPPVQAFLQVIPQSVLKLTSIDLASTVTLTHIAEVFDFGKDYLGLLRAGVIAAGIVPPSLEKSQEPLSVLFNTLIGNGLGLHLTTKVHDIPKGSRLAVSTNLLGSIISICMRATGQTQNVTGGLQECERRLVAARAILGEWLGGSGGGWQDSGGLWPGIKLIEGVSTQPKDPEHGLSRGRLLPLHRQLSNAEAPPSLVDALQKSLVLVHGGLSQNVGPVLEMVTEKYLLREAKEWEARKEALSILDDILHCMKENDVRSLARLTTHNFYEPLQTIIPWASNFYTETLIDRTRAQFGDDFLGFWMLGGCSGGGMGFIFQPEAKTRALLKLQEIMLQTKREMEDALPFAMDPVVYDFVINERGTVADFCESAQVPSLPAKNDTMTQQETCNGNGASMTNDLENLLIHLGFDSADHELIRAEYKRGKLGLRQNRLPPSTKVEDVVHEDVLVASEAIMEHHVDLGTKLLSEGRVAVVTLAAGVGSRWTQGAGCVKAIHPFCKVSGKHRTFLEIHLAKSRRISHQAGRHIPHVVTTSHMTHQPLKLYLDREGNHGYSGPVYLSDGKTIGLRLIPTVRDLKFAFEETQQQKLDEQAQKVKKSTHEALMSWAETLGEASDYRDNLPLQCLHPVGHFYEIPNMLLNGTLQQLLAERPELDYLMMHNIDTVGADVDPGILGLFAESKNTLAFEVIPREIQDVGGGLARIEGKVRLIEGLALPREEDEFMFTFYNSMTTWIHIDKLLSKFHLGREDLKDERLVSERVHSFSNKLPTYVALKDVKKRWGNGQEDVFPTAQFEKLWSDMTSLDEIDSKFFVVPRVRGAQLKDPSQLDGWLRDGSCAYIEGLCEFQE